jgi:hypothetical protein
MNNSIYPKYSKGADADAFEMLILTCRSLSLLFAAP